MPNTLPLIIVLLPNIRFEKASATTGYTWGKPAQFSNILRIIRAIQAPTYLAAVQPLLATIAANDIVAERWLVSDDKEFPAHVFLPAAATAETFRDLLQAHAAELLGEQHLAEHGPFLSCVMKQLDTNPAQNKGSLSVQIHPKPGHPTRPAKPEMWRGQGQIYLGWQHAVTPEEVTAAHTAGTLESLLNAITITPEQLVLVGGGMIHAIRFNSFLYEWSLAPGKDDTNKGNLKDATISPYDRTDGKTPRPGKENLAQSLELLEQSQTWGATDPETIFSTPQVLFDDTAGNQITSLFQTDEVFVDQLTVASQLAVPAAKRGYPIFVDSGTVEISKDGQVLAQLTAGQEAFLSMQLGQYTLTNTTPTPARLYRWYAPFATERAAREQEQA